MQRRPTGTLVEAYLDEDTNDVTIVAINTYVAEVNKVVAKTNSKDAYITLSELAAENGATSGLRATTSSRPLVSRTTRSSSSPMPTTRSSLSRLLSPLRAL